jgi:uncharacterized delta-60 repeat protein
MPNLIKSATTVSNGTIKRNNFLIAVDTSLQYGPNFTPGSKDETFNIGTGFDDSVYQTKIQSDGKIVVGGWFTAFAGSSQNRLIRLNSDGSKDTSFDIGSGFNNDMNSIAIQSDGKILAGGWFTTFTGSTQNRLVRLNSDGSKDSTFNIGTGFDNRVESIAIQSDGKILVGGNFTTFTGSTQNSLIRLNSDGSKDTSFNIGSGFNSEVRSIAIQSNGKILVGGAFTVFSGGTGYQLIRLNSDGSKDSTFDVGNGFNTRLYVIVIQSDGKILAGGSFTTFQDSTQNRLIRLNSDGSKDTSFDIGSGFNNYVESIAIQSDGKIFVGGYYTTYKDLPQNYFIRLNSDGSKDTSFDIGTGFDEEVDSIAIQSDGKILAGGWFTAFIGSSQNRLIRLNTDGTGFWSGIVPPTSGYTVYAQKESQGPSIRVASNDSELITIARQYGGTSINTANDALSFFNGQSQFMVTNIDYENIVTSGLTLLLDAGYIPSYPRSGTTWSDLTVNGNNGTLINGPTFSSDNVGSIVFDGTNDYGLIPNISGVTNFTVANNYTIDFWMYVNSTQNNTQNGDNDILEKWSGPGGYPYTFRYIRSGQLMTTTIYDGGSVNTTSISISSNSWWNICGVFNWSGQLLTVYGNGGQVTSSVALNLTGDISNSSDLNLMRRGNSLNYATGRLSSIKIYNRALSSQEVLQNYNALKLRFGL